MQDKLLFLSILFYIGFIFSSPDSKASVIIPHDEIEITFEPFEQTPQPIVNITVPHDEIEITFISDK